MPVKIPELFQFRKFNVAVHASHVDGAKKFFSGGHVARRTAGAGAAVPRDGVALHSASRTIPEVKITSRRIGCHRPGVHPHGVGNKRREGRDVDRGLFGENFLWFETEVVVKPAVVGIAALVAVVAIGSPDPGFIGGAVIRIERMPVDPLSGSGADGQ